MTRVRVIIQARTSSSRLPGKALMPMGGMPMTVLAARRAANTGFETVIATSNDSSDDHLAAKAHAAGLKVVRGPLADVLARFAMASEDLGQDDIVIRLTADNVLVDGKFLQELVTAFVESGRSYMTSSDPASGLPYGVSAEIFGVGALRKADTPAATAFDREHVTPRIREAQGVKVFDAYASLGMDRLRATVDWPADYDRMASLFAPLSNPVEEHWRALIDELSHLEDKVPKLVLGGAQIGMRYGITNSSAYSSEQSVDLVAHAMASGVGTIDTARAYGESEAVIGRALARHDRNRPVLVTKLDPLADLEQAADPDTIVSAVHASIEQSCAALQLESLPLLCLHRAEHLTYRNGAVWSELLECQRQSEVGRLGVSVQNPEELELALAIPGVSHIQLPYNLLDHRWDRLIEEVNRHREMRGLTIHVRSALLQGLLASDDRELWARAHVDDPGTVIQWLNETAADQGYSGPAELAFAYVITQDWIDGVVTGCDNTEQLDANIALIRKLATTAADTEWAFASRPLLAEQTLNPALWR